MLTKRLASASLSTFTRSVLPRAVVLAVVICGNGGVHAQTHEVLGPSKCNSTCHTDQKTQWSKTEPSEFKLSAHYNGLNQVKRSPNSGKYASAAGLRDPLARNGACVRCHATVYGGTPKIGVSCESCHGAGTSYLVLHQQIKNDDGAYARSVALGLTDLRNNPPVIARTCVGCHVVTDVNLLGAGHGSGKDFNAGASLPKIAGQRRTSEHFDLGAHNPGAVSAESHRLKGPLLARIGNVVTTEKPKGDEVAPPNEAPKPEDDPFAWIARATSLPDEYRPAPITYEPPAIAVERQKPYASPEEPPEPRSPRSTSTRTARAAENRGRVLELLQRVVRERGTLDVDDAGRLAEFTGPDGELLRIQEELAALLLKVLTRRSP